MFILYILSPHFVNELEHIVSISGCALVVETEAD